MKKLAVIISGEFRSFHHVQKFIHFSENVDVFFSCYDTSNETRVTWIEWDTELKKWRYMMTPPVRVHNNHWAPYQIVHSQKITEEEFNEFKERHKGNTYAVVHSTKKRPPRQEYGNTVNMIHNWKKGIEKVIQENHRQGGDYYAGVCILRIDGIHSWNEKKIRENIKYHKDTLFSTSSDFELQEENYLNDLGFHGSYETIVSWLGGMVANDLHQAHTALGEYTNNWGKHKYDGGICHSLSIRAGELDYIDKMYDYIVNETDIDITDMSTTKQYIENLDSHQHSRKWVSLLYEQLRSESKEQFYQKVKWIKDEMEKGGSTLFGNQGWF